MGYHLALSVRGRTTSRRRSVAARLLTKMQPSEKEQLRQRLEDNTADVGAVRRLAEK